MGYFGMRLAFIFAWNGLYCKALFALTPLALLSETCGYVLSLYEADLGLRTMVLSFGVIMIMWSRIAYNFWEREEQLLAQSWDLNRDGHDFLVRPSFHGEWTRRPDDRKLFHKTYSE